jgi:hypothetical protein
LDGISETGQVDAGVVDVVTVVLEMGTGVARFAQALTQGMVGVGLCRRGKLAQNHVIAGGFVGTSVHRHGSWAEESVGFALIPQGWSLAV